MLAETAEIAAGAWEQRRMKRIVPYRRKLKKLTKDHHGNLQVDEIMKETLVNDPQILTIGDPLLLCPDENVTATEAISYFKKQILP